MGSGHVAKDMLGSPDPGWVLLLNEAVLLWRGLARIRSARLGSCSLLLLRALALHPWLLVLGSLFLEPFAAEGFGFTSLASCGGGLVLEACCC